MAGPWDKYSQNTPQSTPQGPWSKYGGSEAEGGLLSKGLDYGLRALDYGGGLVRTGAAGLIDTGRLAMAGLDPNREMADVKLATRPGDAISALKGQAPTSAEFMERAGVPEGGRIDLNPFMKGTSSARDIGGFVADVATDPLGAIGKSGRAAKAVLSPVSAPAEALGKKMYKSGLKKVDERLAEKGTKEFSDVMLERGAPMGTTKRIQKQSTKMMDELAAERKALYQKVNDTGVPVNVVKATEEAEKIVAKMRTDPGLKDQADALSDLIQRYKDMNVAPIDVASEWKTNLYDALPASAFGPNGKVKGQAKKVQQALARGFKEEIERVGDIVEPGLGKKIGKVNEDWGALIQAQKPLDMQVRRATTPNYVTSTDMIIGGAGSMVDPVAAGLAVAAKKGADLSKTTAFRTMGGKGMIEAARSGLLDDLVRRSLINYNRGEE